MQGTFEASNADQNKEAITQLMESYKESYRDPESNPYLYEIDPYYFYEIALYKHTTLNIEAHNLLSVIEIWFYKSIHLIFQNVSFVQVIFYLPLLFTLFCAVILFFMAKEIWNETAGFIAGLFFVSHPVLLEFSMLGFVDTNMLNIFFILASGLSFLYAVKILRTKEHNIKKYVYFTFLVFFIIIFVILFRYTWSAWYVSVGLLIIPLALTLFLYCWQIFFSWDMQSAKTKKATIFLVVFVIVLITLILLYGFGKEERSTVTRIESKFLTSTLKKYLHMEYEDPYGEWPDAFALIKELQTTDMHTFVEYIGGKIPVILSFIVLLWVWYYGVKEKDINMIYIGVAAVTFFLLSVRAIRILPYLIPFSAILFGIGMSTAFIYTTKKASVLFDTKSKSVRKVTMAIILCIFILPVGYHFILDIKEKSNIMPIMDDAIYNSAIFIKEQSDETAKVSTWWDRGTFYKALAEREVHMHSQPHMPTTYWLSSFYMAQNDVQAKNIILMINNNQEEGLVSFFVTYFPKAKAIELLKEVLTMGEDKSVFKEQISFLNYSNTAYPKLNLTVQDSVYNVLLSHFSAQSFEETYIVLIDDLMPRFSAVQYFAAWDFETQQPDPSYPYTDITEYGCLRSQSGVYCSIENRNAYINFTSLQVTAQIPIHEVYVVENNTVQYMQQNTTTTSTSTGAQQWTLITYNRAGYWKAVYLPKQVADSMYVRLMLLDGYNTTYI